MARCSNCGVKGDGIDLHEVNDSTRLCEDCEDDYNAYLDENSEAIAAQERYENFLAEC